MRDYNPDDLADVFIASKSGNPRTIWRMTIDDARKVCSHPSTAGKDWMLCWTAHDLPDTPALSKDDGRFDVLIAELGVTVLLGWKRK